MPGHPSVLRPHDAATLIILRRDGTEPRLLMGKRHRDHKFMPGKFVFPGGRVDAADCRVVPGRDLDRPVADKLLVKMRRGASPNRARGMAMAAVRETFEETGLITGIRHDGTAKTRSPQWRKFHATGYAPDLSGLRYFARAVTPPGRPRRFDARFFVAGAECLANCDAPVTTASDELLELYWFTFDEAFGLDLPWITSEILRRLRKAIETAHGLSAGAPVTYQYMRGNQWHYETI